MLPHVPTLEERDDMSMAAQTRKWTLRELHRLPDDGNKYELVRGELFVTPAPSQEHEELAAVLGRILGPYVAKHRLGRVYRPRAIIRVGESETEPDLMVRPVRPGRPRGWVKAPRPILVVEILSDATRRRDHEQKRSLYLDEGIPEYWIVDGDERRIRVVRPDSEDQLCDIWLIWQPAGAAEPLAIDLPRFFREALDGEIIAEP